MKRIQLVLLLIISLPIFGFWETKSAAACSGGSSPSLNDIIHGDYQIIKATAVDTDAYGNVILHVEQYLTGEASLEYILLVRSSPFMISQSLRGFIGGCGMSVGVESATVSSQILYFVLRRTDEGYFIISQSGFSFPTPETRIRIPLENPDNTASPLHVEMNEAEFVAYIAEHAGNEASLPMTNNWFPHRAILQIMTSGGSVYGIPVDGSPPIAINFISLEEAINDTNRTDSGNFEGVGNCFVEDCHQLSPDRLNLAIQNADNTITRGHNLAIPGQAFFFSPTSDSMVIWNGINLQLKSLNYPRFGDRQQNEITLQGSDDVLNSLVGQGAWTPDGRMFAYSDVDGLWLWDVYAVDSQPRLLLASTNNDIPVARYFSPMGRYLAITQGNQRFTFDVISGTQHPDGLVSPDERNILAFDTSANSFQFRVCVLISNDCEIYIGLAMLPLIIESISTEEPIPFQLTEFSQVEWQNATHFTMYGCSEQDDNICGTAEAVFSGSGYSVNSNVVASLSYDYDPNTNSLAILVDTSTIVIDGQRYELGDYLDGDIVSIRWGESLFHHD